MDVHSIKQRFAIIGNSPLMNRAIDVAAQVANTDLSVLVTGESGVGKEFFPKIIHQLSSRKHAAYVAINCGAIPEGTIDSELFGHEKGAFTDAREARKGYFEEADKGTIFLDEVAELPLSTQVRLLRVLETGEYMKVGSSKVIKTNVRVVAATNVDIPFAISRGSFREDLYYRLNSISIHVPALRQRKEDIPLLFRKFSFDLSERYKMPPLQLNEEAWAYLVKYPWKGNVRELKNVAEQITIIERDRHVDLDKLKNYLPEPTTPSLPVLLKGEERNAGPLSEREILYSLLFDMQKDVLQLKQALSKVIQGEAAPSTHESVQNEDGITIIPSTTPRPHFPTHEFSSSVIRNQHSDSSQTLSLEKSEKEMIQKALEKHHGNRRKAAEDLGISERTIYRKIKEYEIEII